MTWTEFLRWQAFYTLEPWGEWLNDLRFAQMAFLLANAWRGKDTEAYPLSDFIFDWRTLLKEARESDEEEESESGWEARLVEVLERKAQQGES